MRKDGFSSCSYIINVKIRSRVIVRSVLMSLLTRPKVICIQLVVFFLDLDEHESIDLKFLFSFINIEFCKDMKNFNSMFAIISGLDHKTVQRLQATWERVSDKYKKLFEVNYSISTKK